MLSTNTILKSKMPNKVTNGNFNLENINECFEYITNSLSQNIDNTISLFIDLANITKLSVTTPIIYKTVPTLRTKIIRNTKSVGGNSSKYSVDEIFDLLKKIQLSNNNKKIKIFVTCSDYYNTNKENIEFLDEVTFYLCVKNNKLNNKLHDQLVFVGLK